MRSLTFCQTVAMSWSVWLSLLLSCLPAADSVLNTERCQSLEQPDKMWRNSGQSVSLPCKFSSACQSAGFQFQWFVFKQHSHHQLHLNTSTPKYRPDGVGASLNIQSLNVNESGIYYCVAVLNGKHEPGAQMIGSGTTLTVREGTSMVISMLIWLPFTLLTVYSLAVIILIFHKKNGHVICSRGSGRTVDQHDSTTRMQFRAVVQEFSRRNLRCTHNQKDKRGPSQSKAEDPQSNSATDDIYQNL